MTTGERPGPAVEATLTTAFALPKTGLGDVGPVRLADVGLPTVVFERAGADDEWPDGDGVSVDLSVEEGRHRRARALTVPSCGFTRSPSRASAF